MQHRVIGVMQVMYSLATLWMCVNTRFLLNLEKVVHYCLQLYLAELLSFVTDASAHRDGLRCCDWLLLCAEVGRVNDDWLDVCRPQVDLLSLQSQWLRTCGLLDRATVKVSTVDPSAWLWRVHAHHGVHQLYWNLLLLMLLLLNHGNRIS